MRLLWEFNYMFHCECVYPCCTYYLVSSHGDLRRRRFCAQLACLWIDIDHSKFEPHSVSHREAVRRAHRRHRLVLQTIFI